MKNKKGEGGQTSVTDRSGSRGALLIEVILAMLILSVGLTVIIQSMVEGLWAKNVTEDYTRAASLADSQLFDLVAPGPREGLLSAADLSSEGQGKYKFEWEAQEIPSPDKNPAGLQEVTLKISWKSGMNQKELDFTTYLLNASPKK